MRVWGLEEGEGRDERRVREKAWVGAGRGDEAEDMQWGIESDGVRGCGKGGKAGLRGGHTYGYLQPRSVDPFWGDRPVALLPVRFLRRIDASAKANTNIIYGNGGSGNYPTHLALGASVDIRWGSSRHPATSQRHDTGFDAIDLGFINVFDMAIPRFYRSSTSNTSTSTRPTLYDQS